jgi:hypothetical protein
MASHPSIPDRSSLEHHPDTTAHPRTASTLKAFLIAIMGLLSIFVFGLSLEYRSVLWLWIGFICALITGFFVQCLINHNKTLR